MKVVLATITFATPYTPQLHFLSLGYLHAAAAADPVVGPATIETAAESGVNAIVVEAGKTLLLGKNEIERLCGELKISIFAMGETSE